MSDINVTLIESSIDAILSGDRIEVNFEGNATGPPGPTGPAGSTVSSYVHNQSIPLATWTIVHSLESYPAGIVVIDSAKTNIVNFHIEYIDENTLTLEFSGGTSGTAYLS